MKKVLFAVILLAAFCTAKSQYRESHNFLDRLIWDDKMLNIMVDMRADFDSRFYDYQSDEWGFQAQTIKLWLVGEIIPGIRYRVRHRLNKPQQPLREGYSPATDHAWIAIDLGKTKAWTLTLGKQSVALGTFEYDYNFADVYLSTMVNGDFDGYKTGINVAYRFAGQVLNAQLINSDAPQFAREDYSRRALALNLLWEGSLWQGRVKTRIGYGAFQHTKSKFYNWFTPGIQFNAGKFTAEGDYFNGHRLMDYSDIVGVESLGERYVRDQSVALNLKYSFGKLRPSVKGVWNQRLDKQLHSPAYQSAGAEAVVEFYPFDNKYVKDLRFHLMYGYSATAFKGDYASIPNQGAHTALVGIRWLFKVK